MEQSNNKLTVSEDPLCGLGVPGLSILIVRMFLIPPKVLVGDPDLIMGIDMLEGLRNMPGEAILGVCL